MPVSDNPEQNLARILRGIDQASEAKTRVAVFPETALSGFTDEAVARLDPPRIAEAMEQVASRARDRRIYVIYGCATPSKQKRPFNTAIVVGPDGKELTRYHKMVPEKRFEPGDRLALFKIDGVPCTLII
jgi:predicted amidohydrolase